MWAPKRNFQSHCQLIVHYKKVHLCWVFQLSSGDECSCVDTQEGTPSSVVLTPAIMTNVDNSQCSIEPSELVARVPPFHPSPLFCY